MASTSGFRNNAMWIGVAVGAAVGLGYAFSRNKKKSRWENVRNMTKRMGEGSDELVEAGRDLIERARVIYEEGRKVVEDASELWHHGRKLVKA